MIRVGISTRHGMADEAVNCPPEGVEYSFPIPTRQSHRFITSPIKSYLMEFNQCDEFDVMEGVLSPVITNSPWICSLDCYQAAVAFGFLRIPLPLSIRRRFIGRLFNQDNCRQILFWSEFARRSMIDYGGVRDVEIIEKSQVVYPAIRQINALRRTERNHLQLLFSGDFFRKGGACVIDAFEIAQLRFPDAKLYVCCDEKADFNTSDTLLRNEYLGRIKRNRQIEFGRVTREVMLNEILPNTDIYLLPTFNEAFGFALVEAMAFGISVIATNHMAIPEIVTHGETGLLIDLKGIDAESLFRGYVVKRLPKKLHELVTMQLTEYLLQLMESAGLRDQLGARAKAEANSRFSFETRNAKMRRIYLDAIS